MARRPTTPKVRAAAKKNIIKAQVSRFRTREPRSIGRQRTGRKPRLRR